MSTIKNREAIFELKLKKAEISNFIAAAESSMNNMLTQAINHTKAIKLIKLQIDGLNQHIADCEQSIDDFRRQISSIDNKINEKLNNEKLKLKKKGT